VLKLDLTEAVKARMNSREVAPQIAAIRALMLTQAPARAVGTNLIAIASNSTGELRRAALEALGSLRVSTTGAVMLVKAALDDSDPAIRIAAMKSAGALSWKTADIIPSLIEFTRSADANERAQAAETLGNYTTQSTNVLPALQRLLQDPDLCVRTAATNEVRRMESAIGAK
jgi:HEAT repeat protein